MAYTGVPWTNEPSTASPINAENLEIMDNELVYLDGKSEEAESQFSKIDTILSLVDDKIQIPFVIVSGNYAIKYSDGTQVSSTGGYKATDYIDVSAFNKIQYKRIKNTTSTGTVGIAFYNSSKTYISGIGLLTSQSEKGYNLEYATVPSNAKYVRCTTWGSTETYGQFTIAGVSKLSELSANMDDLMDLSEETKPVINKTEYIVPDNKCNPAEIVAGKLASDGTVEANESNSTSGFVPVTKDDVVYLYRNNNGQVATIYRTATCVYNENKQLVAYYGSASQSAFTIPDNVAYIRVSFSNTYTPFIAVNYTGTAYKYYFDPYILCEQDFLTAESKRVMDNLPMREKKIANFGDSIFGNFRGESGSTESISSMVSKMTGANCYNVAFGGTHAKTMTGTDRAPMDFQSLVTAIITGDWTAQEAYATQQGADYLARVRELEAVDFSEIDIVTISYGTNDWSSQVSPSQYSDALNDGITRLGTEYPNLLFVICTPIIRFKRTDEAVADAEDNNGVGEGTGSVISSDSDEMRSSAGYKLTEFAAAAETLGHNMHIPVCENYWTLGINLLNYNTFMNGMAQGDLVHPGVKGRRLIANHLAEALNRL